MASNLIGRGRGAGGGAAAGQLYLCHQLRRNPVFFVHPPSPPPAPLFRNEVGCVDARQSDGICNATYTFLLLRKRHASLFPRCFPPQSEVAVLESTEEREWACNQAGPARSRFYSSGM